MFDQYRSRILQYSDERDPTLDDFVIETRGDLAVKYAPFDYVNAEARVAIFGITPGMHQAKVAIEMAQKALHAGKDKIEALRLAKQAASFSGAMRTNLVDILDYIQIPELVGLSSSAELFDDGCRLAHFNSALRYPVFVAGKNYSGRSPGMLRDPMLKSLIDDILIDELKQLGEGTLLIPLGASVEEALAYAADKAGLREHQVIKGLPHPSGANIERIRYFLGQKARSKLSIKVNPDKIDQGRQLAMESIAAMSRAA